MTTIAFAAVLLQEMADGPRVERSFRDGRWTLSIEGEESLHDRTVVGVTVRALQDVRDPEPAPEPDARELARSRRIRLTAGRWKGAWEYGEGHLPPGRYEISLAVEGEGAADGWTRGVLLAPESGERGYLAAEVERLRTAASRLHRLLDRPAERDRLSKDEFDRLNLDVRAVVEPLRDGAAASPLCRTRRALDAVCFRIIEHADGLTEGECPGVRTVMLSLEALDRAERMLDADATAYARTLLAEVAERTRAAWRRGRPAEWKRWAPTARGFSDAVRRVGSEDAVAMADAVDEYVTLCERHVDGSAETSPESVYDALRSRLPLRDIAD